MNNIGFGIFCFGEDYYYQGTFDKIRNILNGGYHCYILTDTPEKFTTKYSSSFLHIIQYDRTFKSYADKMILPKHILKKHDISILLDADTHVTDFSFLKDLKTYEFKYGISYIDTLLNHKSKKEFVKNRGVCDGRPVAHRFARVVQGYVRGTDLSRATGAASTRSPSTAPS